MLKPEQQKNVKDLLVFLSDEDILSVAAVNTNKLLPVKTRDEAIKAILLHETSYTSILSRKKVTRSVLFNYLHSKELACDGPLDKNALINLIIKYWTETSDSLATIPDPPISPAVGIATELAAQFSGWFYNKLNEDFYKHGGPPISEADFWPDCQALIHLPETPDGDTQDFSADSAADSVVLLRSFRSQYDLYFSPNLNQDGVGGKMDPHGLVLVTVHGTLHSKESKCVGLFKQVFGLIPDPMSENNYKIKKTTLFIQKADSGTKPAKY